MGIGKGEGREEFGWEGVRMGRDEGKEGIRSLCMCQSQTEIILIIFLSCFSCLPSVSN